jgi:hypothetical protein
MRHIPSHNTASAHNRSADLRRSIILKARLALTPPGAKVAQHMELHAVDPSSIAMSLKTFRILPFSAARRYTTNAMGMPTKRRRP